MTQDSYLSADGTYETPAHAGVSPRSWAGIRFYAGLIRIVFSGYRLARRRRFDAAAWRDHSWRVLRLVEAVGGRIRAEGFHHLARQPGPRVYVSNHMSMIETLILPGFILLFEDVVVVVKKSLLSYPLFGPVVRRIDAIAVERKRPREDFREVLTRGAEWLAKGRSVLLFPQHTRSLVFEPARFNSLGAKLAARARVPLVPVAVRTDFLGMGRWIRDFGRVDVTRPVQIAVGPPLKAEGREREAQREALEFVRDRVAAWGVTVIESAREGERHGAGPADEHSVR